MPPLYYYFIDIDYFIDVDSYIIDIDYCLCQPSHTGSANIIIIIDDDYAMLLLMIDIIDYAIIDDY
jgi:hypothetical protein